MWLQPPDIPLDRHGPVDVPFAPMEQAWIGRPMLDRLRHVAALDPDRIALADSDTQLSYRELWRLSCRLGATFAKAQGSGPIAVALPDGPLYVAALLACLAAGRISVPLDCNAPAARNAEITRDAQVVAIVVAAYDGHDPVPDHPEPLRISIETGLATGDTPDEPVASFDPGAPALILYTSGSTGAPKGVALSQTYILHRVRLMGNASHYGPADRVLSLGPTANVSGVGTLATNLLFGTSSFIVDITRTGVGAVLRMLRERRVTVLRGTPSLVKLLIRLEGAREALASVRLLRLGGEPLVHADVQEMRACLPAGCPIGITLASTEAFITLGFIPPESAPGPVTSGYLVPGYEAQVLDERDAPSKAGEPGELVLRSRYLASGDWRDGRLVKDRLPADPEDPSRRIFRTGDLVRLTADGAFIPMGRKDRQIKIRGQRVEPIEIEVALRAMPDVRDAVVLPRHDGTELRLMAFVVPRTGGMGADGKDGLAIALRRQLAATLPGGMQPARIAVLETLPLLPGGKVDARALLARDPLAAGPAAGLRRWAGRWRPSRPEAR